MTLSGKSFASVKSADSTASVFHDLYHGQRLPNVKDLEDRVQGMKISSGCMYIQLSPKHLAAGGD